MAAARSIRCSECRRVFTSDERPGYIGYDHLLDEHRELLTTGRIDSVTLGKSAAGAAIHEGGGNGNLQSVRH